MTWPQQLLRPDRLWPLTAGAGQRVAVVSTGIAEHPQLSGTVAAGSDLAPAPEFGEPSGAPDCVGIGTGVAGVIGAQSVDGVGFHGVAPEVELLSAKVVGDQFPTNLEPRNSVTPGVLARGIDWAVDQSATVIVVATVAHQGSGALEDAVSRALSNDIVVVASVGPIDATGEQAPAVTPYPAAYDGVIGVGAIDQAVAAGNPQLGYIDLVAPGVEILTTYPGAGLGPASGAEFAAGYVAATAALVRAYRPELSTEEVAHRLFATAAPAPEAAVSPRYGYGIVYPYGAVLDRVVDGEPAALDRYRPDRVGAEELARRAAEQESRTRAIVLALAGIGLALLLTVAVTFGRSGRRRRWRTGLAAPPGPDSGPQVGPPVELFGDRPSQP